MTDLVVTDTSCLIALDRVGLLGLLPALFEVHAPEAVAVEFGRRPAWLRVVAVDPDAARRAPLDVLDAGEAAAIALALTYADVQVLMDEVRGRAVAASLGLRVVGTAGVLLVAKRQGLLPAVGPVLEALVREHAFRLAPRTAAEILKAAGEA